jgi:release factor glutamine methyltransferase
MNIENALGNAYKILSNNNIRSSKLDSEILMAKAIQKDRKFVILNLKKEIEKKSFDYFKNLVHQRSSGKPIAYLLGKKNFWNFEFVINKDVLVPRPDTEILVEEVLRITKHRNNLKILDVGIGSGCILLSILNEKKDFYGIGVDVSKKCLDLSAVNAKKIGVVNRVKFIKSDVDNFNSGKYDLIISNPPYIKSFDIKYLEKDIVNFEPKLALDGGLEGLSELSKVINKSSELIKLGGKLILEIGFDQKDKVKQLLKNKGFYINKILKDYANKDRCIISTKL